MTTKAPKTKHCSVTAHNGFLVVEYHTLESVAEEVTSPYDSSSMGFVISDVGFVGVSNEAYELLKTIRPGRDSLGELDIFRGGPNGYVFGTLGGACGLFKATTVETSRDYRVPYQNEFQLIANDVPEGAKEAIDNPEEDDDE